MGRAYLSDDEDDFCIIEDKENVPNGSQNNEDIVEIISERQITSPASERASSSVDNYIEFVGMVKANNGVSLDKGSPNNPITLDNSPPRPGGRHSNTQNRREGRSRTVVITDRAALKAINQPSTSRGPPPVISPLPRVAHSVGPEFRVQGGGNKRPLGETRVTKEEAVGEQIGTEQKTNTITGDAIAAMHNSLSTAPEDVPTATPEDLKTELKSHQKTGLTWLLWRERQSPPGGILADDMGLGKTLLMLALIAEKKKRLATPGQEKEERGPAAEKIKRHLMQKNRLVPSNATLVIAPASLIYQWEKEVKDRIKFGKFRVFVFHGSKEQRQQCDPHRLARYDLVITTYQTVAFEISDKPKRMGDDDQDSVDGGDVPHAEINSPFAKKTKSGKPKPVKRFFPMNSDSALTKILWERVILDEAHQIKNRHSLCSRAVCRIPSIYRWCLTGTPVHNELWDLFSLVRFLRVSPFSEESVWKDLIITASATNSGKRLNTLVKCILLRRTKNQIDNITQRPLIELTQRHSDLVPLKMKELEAKCYNILFEASKQKVKSFLDNHLEGEDLMENRHGEKPTKNPFLYNGRVIDADDKFQVMSCILVLLLRLRQACVHLALTKKAVDINAFKDDAAFGDAALGQLDKTLSQMTLDGAIDVEAILGGESGEGPEEKEDVEAIFEPAYVSTKIGTLLERMQEALNKGDKCVVVSQWTGVLELLEPHLRRNSIPHTSITGAVQTRERQERAESFNNPNGGPRVLLLSLTAGGVGLNLVGGNHLFLLDPHWNPAVEAQACDRIYRMGQSKNVFIHKLVCEKTIEQRVLQLQEKKMALAKGVLEGATAKSLSKLSVADLRWLFDLK